MDFLVSLGLSPAWCSAEVESWDWPAEGDTDITSSFSKAQSMLHAGITRIKQIQLAKLLLIAKERD